MAVKRVLLQFEKGGKNLLSEYPLKEIDLAELQALFGESADDPMFHSYDVTSAQAERLEVATGIQLDLDSFDYCIQAYSVQ